MCFCACCTGTWLSTRFLCCIFGGVQYSPRGILSAGFDMVRRRYVCFGNFDTGSNAINNPPKTSRFREKKTETDCVLVCLVPTDFSPIWGNISGYIKLLINVVDTNIILRNILSVNYKIHKLNEVTGKSAPLSFAGKCYYCTFWYQSYPPLFLTTV